MNKILAILLLICTLTTGIVSISNRQKNPSEADFVVLPPAPHGYVPATMEEANQLSKLQQNAVQADSILWNVISQDFPADFCGDWIEGEYLVIGLTDISPEVTDRYDKILGYWKKYVKYTKQSHSYRELESLGVSIREQLTSDFSTCVYEMGILEEQNVLGIGVAELSSAAFSAFKNQPVLFYYSRGTITT